MSERSLSVNFATEEGSSDGDLDMAYSCDPFFFLTDLD